LRLEVESLLDQNADSFLESGLVSPALAPGTRLGNFELVELIGRGGPPYPTPMLPVSVTLGGVPLPAANIAFCRPDLLRRGADEHLDPVQRSYRRRVTSDRKPSKKMTRFRRSVRDV
jgi:hypothetical protein